MQGALTTILYCFLSIAACLSVTTYFRLPNVVGYLAAGILAGPVLGIVVEGEEFLDFAEVGVLMLLFSVGIRVDPVFLIRNSKRFASAAFASFAAISVIYFIIIYSVDMFSMKATVAVSMAMAFSSQLVAFQSQDISKNMKSTGGQFAIFSLIFQLFIFSSLFIFSNYLSGQEIKLEDVLRDATVLMFSIALIIIIFYGLIGSITPYAVGTDNKDLLLAIVIASMLAILFFAHLVGVSPQMLFLVAGVSLGRSPYNIDIIKFIEPIVGIFAGLFLFFLGWNLNLESIGDGAALLFVAVTVLFLVKAAILLVFGYYKTGSVGSAKEYIKIMLPPSEMVLVILPILSVSDLISFSAANLISSYIVVGMIWTSLMAGRRPGYSAPVSEARRLRVFFSYSRRDESVVKAIADRLEEVGLVPLIDTRVLPHGRQWQQQLSFAIRSCDVVLWFISPDSAKSETCTWELHQAIGFQKRIVPVRLVETDPDEIPQELAAIQFLPAAEPFLIERGDHWSALFNVVTEHDDWIRFRTSLLEKATSWGASGRNNYMLLGREELAVVERWWDLRPSSEPPLSFTVTEFIATSREALSPPGKPGTVSAS
ncbi:MULTISPECIES: TIR domain-containing protein [unclassified Ensifer]|uniref:TIR domain-containing protein n=1 Tax=unclassified Ensifer TaxID=2633371 RepID=UPI0009EC27A9|nr:MULTISPECIES: TIR domain-containing protein [unclassified Ensifer]